MLYYYYYSNNTLDNFYFKTGTFKNKLDIFTDKDNFCKL